jgi:hypothetical protein
MCSAAANNDAMIAHVDCRADDGTEFREGEGIYHTSTEQDCKNKIAAANKTFKEYATRTCKDVNDYLTSGDGDAIKTCPGRSNEQTFVHFSSRCGCPLTDDTKCGSEHNENDKDCCAPNGEDMWCHDGYTPERTGQECSDDPNGMFTCRPPSHVPSPSAHDYPCGSVDECLTYCQDANLPQCEDVPEGDLCLPKDEECDVSLFACEESKCEPSSGEDDWSFAFLAGANTVGLSRCCAAAGAIVAAFVL